MGDNNSSLLLSGKRTQGREAIYGGGEGRERRRERESLEVRELTAGTFDGEEGEVVPGVGCIVGDVTLDPPPPPNKKTHARK